MTAMEQITQVSILARNAGLSYGEYVKKFGSPFPPPERVTKLEKHERVCTKCGKVFEPGLTKSGLRSHRTICFECEKKCKVGKPKPMGLRKVKEYAVKCSRCGAKMITRRAPSPMLPNYCEECRPIVNRQRCREKYEKKKARRR